MIPFIEHVQATILRNVPAPSHPPYLKFDVHTPELSDSFPYREYEVSLKLGNKIVCEACQIEERKKDTVYSLVKFFYGDIREELIQIHYELCRKYPDYPSKDRVLKLIDELRGDT